MTRVTAPELLLCNARVPAGADRTIPSDVLISGDGRIREIAPRIDAPGITPIDLGGSLMVLAHIVFVGHFLAMALRFGPTRTDAALFLQNNKKELSYGQ